MALVHVPSRLGRQRMYQGQGKKAGKAKIEEAEEFDAKGKRGLPPTTQNFCEGHEHRPGRACRNGR
jgi:hypothetical protein